MCCIHLGRTLNGSRIVHKGAIMYLICVLIAIYIQINAKSICKRLVLSVVKIFPSVYIIYFIFARFGLYKNNNKKTHAEI